MFTDIEGSTTRWEHDRVAMQAAVRRHDTLVRAALVEHHGHVFKTVGDAFCVAFSRPQDAVAALLAAQRALAAEDFSAVDGLRVRAAIHTGTADERDADYFGPAVNRVARLLAIAHGGQVLLSGVTADLVAGELPPRASLRDLGEHRLRDLTRPEYVYQLLAPDLAAEFPPLQSLDVLSNNLPQMRTTFIGRERELAEIIALIDTHALVTLVGSGGIGKTRTSLQVAANLLDGSGDGVFFIELAPLASGEYVPSTIATALNFTLGAGRDPIDDLVRALKPKRALLVFDNCEHLIEPVARVLAAILSDCPKIKILASSRQGLGLRGEATYRMPSLVLPSQAEAAQLTVLDMMRFAAIALFVERAGASNNGFSLTDENAPVVADICRRLDGIPLAIELAASRVKILSPRQLRARLDERFRVLTGGSRDVLPRQQTLRALIDWSHDLLDERERALLRRLGIFVNGLTLEGAAAVSDDLDEFDVIDVLASLVDKSLVLAEPDGDSLRYRLLESTRVYALEKLDAAGERELAAGRHLGYLVSRFAALRERVEQTARQAGLTEALQTELEDVRSALDGALERLDVIEGGELLADIDRAWSGMGLYAESIARCERYLAALSHGDSRVLARVSMLMSHLVGESGQQVRAFAVATEALAHARASGDASILARALGNYAGAAVFAKRLDEAEAALAQGEAITVASPSSRRSFLQTHALLSQFRGDYETALRMHEQQRKENRSLGNAREELVAAVNLAELEHARGQTQRAITIVHEMLPAARHTADKSNLSNLLDNLAGYLAAADDVGGADAAAREAIGILATREPDHVYVAIGIEHLALVFALCGDVARAAKLQGHTVAVFARRGFEREFTETTTHERLTALLREHLAPGELARLLREGAAFTSEAAIAIALEER